MDSGSALHSAPRRVVDEALSRLQLGRRRLPVIQQTEAGECGLACLAMIAGHYGHRIDLQTLRARHPVSSRGANLAELAATASALHLSSRALKLELSELSKLRTPCILHWDLAHFVVLRGVEGSRAIVHDPACGIRTYTHDEISRHFTGIALECVPTPEFTARKEETPLRMQDLWKATSGLYPALLQLLILTGLLQLFSLAAPFFTQTVVDRVLVSGNVQLLGVLAVGFGGLLLVQLLTKSLRDYSVLHLSSVVSLQLSSNMLGHLIRLPQPWFLRRHLGDVLSRFGSLEPVRALLTTGVIGALLDGGMALTMLALLLLYSPTLTLWVLVTALAYAVLRALAFAPLRQLEEEAIVAGARENSHLMETLRGIQAIKLMGLEADREGHWQNLHANSMNAGIRASKWGLAFSLANGLLFGIQNIAIVYLAAHMVIDQRFTVGMLYAFLAYQGQFTSRIGALIDSILGFRMLRVHMVRLADVALAPEEPNLRGAVLRPSCVLDSDRSPSIELRRVSFRYGDREPWILRHVSLRSDPGSLTVLVGASGSGKSTLLRLLLGLLEPIEGQILIDGQPLAQLDRAAHRRRSAAVMQDDHLLSGTLLENITGFDPAPDMARVELSTRDACLHDEIQAMPLGYLSRICDLGIQLSGGQRQRLLLARSLYRDPRLLIVDEGTAHLDPALETRISSTIGSSSATRIVVTHRPGILEQADQLLRIHDGRLHPFAASTTNSVLPGAPSGAEFQAGTGTKCA